MYGYRFLVDNDCRWVASLLPKALGLKDVGLPENAPDEEIIEEAADRRCIIVTANGYEYRGKIKRFVAASTKKEWGCCDVWGLVVVPNDLASQERLVSQAEQRLRFGERQIDWSDVWWESLVVRITKDNRPIVSQLPRCPGCIEDL
jgi:hypothetical protein